MTFQRIVGELKAERDRLDQAIAAIESLKATNHRGGRPAGSLSAPKRRRRGMSAAGRKRISEAAKKRWAVWRKRRVKA
jgi:hypothetical protein